MGGIKRTNAAARGGGAGQRCAPHAADDSVVWVWVLAEGGWAITVEGVEAEVMRCSHVVSATCACRRMDAARPPPAASAAVRH